VKVCVFVTPEFVSVALIPTVYDPELLAVAVEIVIEPAPETVTTLPVGAVVGDIGVIESREYE
jgi:hypothetical protein